MSTSSTISTTRGLAAGTEKGLTVMMMLLQGIIHWMMNRPVDMDETETNDWYLR